MPYSTAGKSQIGNRNAEIGKSEVLFAALCALALVISIMFCAEALAQTQTPAKKPVQICSDAY